LPDREAKNCTLGCTVVEPQTPTVRRDQPIGNEEAQAKPTGGASRRGETLENVCGLLDWYAWTRIGYEEGDLIVRRLKAYPDLAAGWGELDRVRKQIAEHLNHARGIDEDRYVPGCPLL
jgi:hypothetical protein